MPGSDSDSGVSAHGEHDWYIPPQGDDSSSDGSDHSQDGSPPASEPEDDLPDVPEAPVDRRRATGPADSRVQRCQDGFVASCRHCLALCLAAQHRNLTKAGDMRIYALHEQRPGVQRAIVMDADHIHELLTYFMETACVEVEPENTRLYRTVLLRILYSVGSVDIQACVATLLENGIFLGSYDRAATVQSLYDKITVMHIPDWVYLMRFVRVESVDGIFHALQEVYQDSIAESPLWKLKTTFEENAVDFPETPSMIIHIFLALFNREIDRGAAIASLLVYAMDLPQTNDLTLRILGPMSSTYSPENVACDVCVVLQALEIGPIHELQAEMLSQPRGGQARPPAHVGHLEQLRVRSCRMSMLQLQREMLALEGLASAAGRGVHGAAAAMPCDLPLSQEAWDEYSCAQQQVVLLLASVRLDAVEDKDARVAQIVGARGRISFAAYTTPRSKCELVAPMISALLLRIGETVDLQKLETCVLAKQFAEACFGGVFGGMQLAAMTTVFHMQLYFIAFLDSSMRSKCYHTIAERFNSRIHAAHRHMILPDYIPHSLSERMDEFSRTHTLPAVVVLQVLQPLCV